MSGSDTISMRGTPALLQSTSEYSAVMISSPAWTDLPASSSI